MTTPSGGSTTEAITPNPNEVHDLIAARPSFTSDSRPSTGAVERLINLSVRSLVAEFGEHLGEKYFGKARFIVSLHAASIVEQTYFPEQQSGSGQGATLYQWYKDELMGLRALLGSEGGSGPGPKIRSLSLGAGLAEPLGRRFPRGADTLAPRRGPTY